jgi:hypothetical protein
MPYKRDRTRSSTQESVISSIHQINTPTFTSNNPFESDQSVISPRDLESHLSFSQPKPSRTPLMRKSDAPPPASREGATTTRQSKKMFRGTAASWWTVTSKAMTCCCLPFIYLKKLEGGPKQAYREKIALASLFRQRDDRQSLRIIITFFRGIRIYHFERFVKVGA